MFLLLLVCNVLCFLLLLGGLIGRWMCFLLLVFLGRLDRCSVFLLVLGVAILLCGGLSVFFGLCVVGLVW